MHVFTYTEPGPCQCMRLMTGGQGGVAALGPRPHQLMPMRQMVQGQRHFGTQGHLISQGGLPGAMSLLGQVDVRNPGNDGLQEIVPGLQGG